MRVSIVNARAEPIIQQAAWKPEEWNAYACAVVHSALRNNPSSFSACDVPEAESPASSKLPGNVFAALKAAHVIEPVYLPNGQIERRMSTHASRKSAWENVYRLVSVAAGETFLQRHECKIPARLRDQELFAAEVVSRRVWSG